ncbi:hypothetical protein ACQY0O_004653 [Thecaphora frezii]
MVNPFMIAAAASAGIGAAVAFEFSVFRPWREENWPNGFREGLKAELEKLRKEFEEGVTEIRDDIRGGLQGRRGRDRGNAHHRLSDEELNDFRRGRTEVGGRYRDGPDEEQPGRGLIGRRRSSSSATIRGEFELHERQASAYRDHLAASMVYGKTTGLEAHSPTTTLRRRNPPDTAPAQHGSFANAWSGPFSSPTPPMFKQERQETAAAGLLASPEVPHHALGDASPTIDTASLAGDVSAGGQDLTSLLPSSPSPTPSQRRSDPFDDLHRLDETNAISSWQDAFARADPLDASPANASAPLVDADPGPEDAWRDVARSSAGSSVGEARPASPAPSTSLVHVSQSAEVEGAPSPTLSYRSRDASSDGSDMVSVPSSHGEERGEPPLSPRSAASGGSNDHDHGSRLDFQSLSLYLDAQAGEPTSPSYTATSGAGSELARSDVLDDEETWLPLEVSVPTLYGRRASSESDGESWAELGRSDDSD